MLKGIGKERERMKAREGRRKRMRDVQNVRVEEKVRESGEKERGEKKIEI
jgi:hypothetical protein